MRYLYTFLFYLAIPFIFLRLLWRSRRLPAYRKRLAERLGYYPFKLDSCIWVHAVSVGETIAATPLIKALQARYPKRKILVTTMTPTGAERVKAAFGASVDHAYLPYDLPAAITRFLNAMHPVIGIIMETELWPNLIAVCHRKNIPLCLVNARLSEKSAGGYRAIAPLTHEMLSQLAVIAANETADAERFISLGAPKDRVQVTGNLKFDLQLPPDLPEKAESLRAELGKERFIWIAASTHEGEEEIVLAAHKKIREQNPKALLILVPRHPDRFDAVANLCEQTLPTVRRTQSACTAETAVYLADTMGELLLMYAVSDVALVCGSLIPRGGHNLLEPAALAKPLLSGPHVFNFAEISELFLKAQALTKVDDAKTLADAVMMLMQYENLRKQRGESAKQVMDENRGALQKQLEAVEKVILSTSS